MAGLGSSPVQRGGALSSAASLFASHDGNFDAPHLVRVLVVDDNRSVLDTFGRLLQQAGFLVTTAPCAQSGLDAARGGFDVMLLDWHLGQESGLDVLRTVRQEGISGRVVVITGFDIADVESEAHRLGALFVDRWTLPDPVALVRHVLATWGAEPVNPPDGPPLTPPALTRWAEVVARAVASSDEPKTVASWARIAGRSSVSGQASHPRSSTAEPSEFSKTDGSCSRTLTPSCRRN